LTEAGRYAVPRLSFYDMKGIFKDRSPRFQLFVFITLTLLCVFGGGMTGFIVGLFFGGGDLNAAASSFYAIHAQQFVSSLSFLAAPIAYAWLCSDDVRRTLALVRVPSIYIYLITALMVFCLSPTIDLVGSWNADMHLPEALAPLEEKMRLMEDLAAEITDRLLAEQGFAALLLNIFVIGFMAALCEEALFRGGLQLSLMRLLRNPHLAIWLTAFLFSAIHLQFYGFLPRLLLGAFLGYLLYRTGSLLPSILAHFINNATIVIARYFGLVETSADDWFLAPDNPAANLLIALAGLALFFLLVILLKRLVGKKGSAGL